MESLTSKQRAHLRSLAHRLKPVVQVGVGGVSEETLRALREALNTRELLKVKVSENAPQDVREAAEALREGVQGVHVVQTIGRTVVLYREDPDEPEIRLPR